MENVIKFYGRKLAYFCFSNFYRSSFELDGKIWTTTEHYYQSQKFLDENVQEEIRLLPTPREAADKGRDRSLPLRSDWEEVKDDVMLKCVREKFKQNENLKFQLISTGDATLIEDSPSDYYWGCGRDGSGKNMLGQVLMKVREELKN